MINTGDKLICTKGNHFYVEGDTYTVGRFVNDKYFEVMPGKNEERWYASITENGVYVSFEDIPFDYSNAWFETVQDKSEDWLENYTGNGSVDAQMYYCLNERIVYI